MDKITKLWSCELCFSLSYRQTQHPNFIYLYEQIYCVGYYDPVKITEERIVTQAPLLTMPGMSVHLFNAMNNESITNVKEN